MQQLCSPFLLQKATLLLHLNVEAIVKTKRFALQSTRNDAIVESPKQSNVLDILRKVRISAFDRGRNNRREKSINIIFLSLKRDLSLQAQSFYPYRYTSFVLHRVLTKLIKILLTSGFLL